MTSATESRARPLRVLLLEDDPDDAALLSRALRANGRVVVELVHDRGEFAARIERGGCDIVIADYRLKGFTGLDALRLLRERGLDLPFILVTGALEDEVAAQCFQFGAADYILKDRLARLPQAVRRALDERRLRETESAAREALRRSEETYRLLFERSPICHFIFDADSRRFLAVNEAAVERYGYTREEFLELTLDQVRAPAADLVGAAPLHRAVAGATEERHRRWDGRVLVVEVAIHDISFVGRPAKLMLAQDVTERHELEEQLRQAQKMEAVGRLAGGIAHDFNNLLMVMRGFGELLLDRMPAGSAERRNLEKITAAAERATVLIRQLLAFSRRQVLAPRILDLNTVLAEMEKLLPRLLGEQIEVRVRQQEALRSVYADPVQLEQVLINLAINARDAMPAGGTLVISASDALVDDLWARRHAELPPGRYVLLTVTDTGRGMDGETQAHVFEPFFTTKEEGKGTGLGLAMVYGIVRQSGGVILVHSATGEGTTFKIFFPASAAAQRAAGAELALCGAEEVLLVDEEAPVREAAREFLAAQGYKIIAAAGPQQALAAAEAAGVVPALLITAAELTGITGGELARALGNLHPDLPVLYLSGSMSTAVSHQARLDGGAPVLEKPFSWELLARRVRQLLDSASSRPAEHRLPAAAGF